MLTALPWQLQWLVAEALISMVLGWYYIEKGIYVRSGPKGIFFALSDAVCIGFMIWAGSGSWEHVVYMGLYVWAIVAGLRGTFGEKAKDVVFVAPDQTASGTVVTAEIREKVKTFQLAFSAVISMVVVLLIVTG